MTVAGVFDAAQLHQTVGAIASVQTADGNIAWTPDTKTDPWNLVEAAMALDVGGLHDNAERAYGWLRSIVSADRP